MQAASGLRKGGVILILPSQYYEENLYPLQDGVLNIINRSGTDFFLTGGTALSRGYYHHMLESEFNTIAWYVKPDWDRFKRDIHNIVFNMLNN